MDPGSFMPHGMCYLWLPRLVALHVASDAAIFLSYMAIPAMLSYILLKRKDIPFDRVVICFGLFIVACGGTHLMDVITVWRPYYWLSGALKAITALASLGTAIILFRLVPALLTHPTRADWDEKTRELERQKIEQQFLANVSHDLRTPIASIRGYAETLLGGGLDDAENRVEFVRVIERNAQRLDDLMDRLLALATVDAAKVREGAVPVPLRDFVEEVVDDLLPNSHRAKVALLNEVDDAVVVRAHEQHLWQILQNLLGNALKYVPGGGHVRVTAEALADQVLVTVSDDGPGIEADQLARVFDRFHSKRTGKPNSRGAGLGLTIVRTLVEAHGGRVWAENAPSGGAVFHFTLPRSAHAATRA